MPIVMTFHNYNLCATLRLWRSMPLFGAQISSGTRKAWLYFRYGV